MTVLVQIFTLCLITFAKSRAWVNDYDQPASFQCLPGNYLSTIISKHHSAYEDRVWDFRCSKLDRLTTCDYTDYKNDWQQWVSYECPDYGAIVGIDSQHDNQHEDRRFRFKCCKWDATRLTVSSCRETSWLNEYDYKIAYQSKPNEIIVGFYSKYSAKYKDRSFYLKVCDYTLI